MGHSIAMGNRYKSNVLLRITRRRNPLHVRGLGFLLRKNKEDYKMKSYTITVNGNVYDVTVEENGSVAAPAAAPRRAAAPVAAPAAPKAAAPAGGAGAVKIEAGAAGKVFKIEAQPGAAVCGRPLRQGRDFPGRGRIPRQLPHSPRIRAYSRRELPGRPQPQRADLRRAERHRVRPHRCRPSQLLHHPARGQRLLCGPAAVLL